MPHSSVALLILATRLCSVVAQTCDASSFPVPTPDEQCFGLYSIPLADESIEACIGTCCALGADKCSVWQWCPSTGDCWATAGHHCWLGEPTLNGCREGKKGWVGGIRPTAPVVGSYYEVMPMNSTSAQFYPLSRGLRHCSSIMSADPPTIAPTADFQWRFVEAITSDAASFSLEAANYYFHYAAMLPIVDPAMNPTTLSAARISEVADPSDMTWRLVTPAIDGSGFYSIISASSNPAWSGLFLSVTASQTNECKHTDSFDLVLLPAGATIDFFGNPVLSQSFGFFPVDVLSRASWTTEHANAQNNGFSSWDGPGEAESVCREEIIRDDPTNPDFGTRFWSSGVTSAEDGWWFGGDSDNVVHMLEDVLVSESPGSEAFHEWTLNLAQSAGVTPVTDFGIIGAPAALQDISTAKNLLFVASADGYVYALNTMFCFSQARNIYESSGGAPPARHAARRASSDARAVRARSRSLRGSSSIADITGVAMNGGVDSTTGQWALYSNINGVYNYANQPDRDAYKFFGRTVTWEECRDACVANYTAGGGEPTSCVVWTWHDPFVGGKFANWCVFKYTAGFDARYQKDHVTGFLTTAAPGPACIEWFAKIGTGPSYSPARVISFANDGGTTTAVLVSETDPNLDCFGVLHAFDARSGVELFKFTAKHGMDSWGLKGVVPAQLPQEGRIVLLAYGTTIVAINAFLCIGRDVCDSIATFDNSDVPGGGDHFVSSVALSPDGAAAYVHSSTGTLWRVAVSYDDTQSPPVSFQLSWACNVDQVTGLCVSISESLSVRDAQGVDRPRAEFSGRGFYQPTTKTQAVELYASVAAAHAALFGADAGAPLNDAERADAAVHAARLANVLPKKVIGTLTTPSGYTRLLANGKPGFDAKDPGGTFPFATPALYFDC